MYQNSTAMFPVPVSPAEFGKTTGVAPAFCWTLAVVDVKAAPRDD